MFSVHNEPFQIWARKKAKVKDFKGLKGKVVNIGNPGSGQTGTIEEIMKEMREKKISPWNLKNSIENILENATINENEKFFLARMLYPHIDLSLIHI